MLESITFQFIQESPIAFSVSDNDICASCRHCAYAPGDLSLCKVQLDDVNHAFPGEQDGGGEIVRCAQFVEVDLQEENWVSLD